MITAQIESYTDTLEEMKPLHDRHWEDLALDKDKVPLAPQYDVYLARDAMGEVLYATLREDGVLVGYFIGFVAPGLHYKTCLTLTMDIFWTEYGARNKGGALKLFRLVETEAKRRGVQRLFYGSKLHKDVSRLFEALKCVKVETYYSKWLGD